MAVLVNYATEHDHHRPFLHLALSLLIDHINLTSLSVYMGSLQRSLFAGMAPDRGHVWWHRVLEELAVAAPLVSKTRTDHYCLVMGTNPRILGNRRLADVSIYPETNEH